MQSTSLPDSPCIRECRIDTMVLGKYVCGGCLRTLAEIAAWSNMSDELRLEVLALIEARKTIRGS